MRRILFAAALAAGSLTFAPGVTRAPAANLGSCPPPDSGVGIEIPTPTTAGPMDVVVCIWPSDMEGYEVKASLLAKPGSGWGYNWLDVGVNGGACQRTSTGDDTCVGTGTSSFVRVDPYPEGGLWFGGESACAGTPSSYWGECILTIHNVYVDGPSGETMGAGVFAAVCYQGDSYGFFCVPTSLGLPHAVNVDLTAQRDLAYDVIDAICNTGLCDPIGNVAVQKSVPSLMLG
jgi:hypothetical protein